MLIPFFVSVAGWQEYRDLSSTSVIAILFLGVGCSGLGYWFLQSGNVVFGCDRRPPADLERLLEAEVRRRLKMLKLDTLMGPFGPDLEG